MSGRHLAWALPLALPLAMMPWAANAKTFGVHSPVGRQIYDDEETFGEVMDQSRRWMVVEVAVGAGPEGNLAMLLGLLNVPIRHMELYGGIGLEANPGRHYTGAVRYWFDFAGFRPYAGIGYLLVHLNAIDTYSHNVFGEVGYKWKFHRTYHLTVGAGLRRILSVDIEESSVLRAPDVDPAFLDAEQDAMYRWVPTLALRFSRAF